MGKSSAEERKKRRIHRRGAEDAEKCRDKPKIYHRGHRGGTETTEEPWGAHFAKPLRTRRRRAHGETQNKMPHPHKPRMGHPARRTPYPHNCSTSGQARTADSGGKPPHSTRTAPTPRVANLAGLCQAFSPGTARQKPARQACHARTKAYCRRNYRRKAMRPATIVAIGAPRNARPSNGVLRDLLGDSAAR